ncbi:hypothetical protein [Propioniciclava soli]|uniref:Uncharacterized protein n=1 Tax=Propioniciclava soli TaxID=2775081 RepID=A0ABZ3C7L9_9ACTN|nr:hypothetical protein [Propioniciclava soli]
MNLGPRPLIDAQAGLAGGRVGGLTLIGQLLRRTRCWARIKATLADVQTRDGNAAEPVASAAALLALVRAGATDAETTLATTPVTPFVHRADAFRVRLGQFIDAATQQGAP